jgi:tetratricopeptide (TPR) repeat protein
MRLSEIYRRLGWVMDANLVIDQAVKLAPRSLPVLRERAMLDAQSGFQQDAQRWATTLTKRFPKSPYGFSLLADTHAEAGRWREAVTTGEQAIQRDPRDPAYLVRQAQYQLMRTDTPDPEAALRLLQQARSLDPQDLGARYWTGMAHLRQGRTREAVTELTRVYQEDPEFETVRFQLAELHRASGNRGEAERLRDEAKQQQRLRFDLDEALARARQQPRSAEAHVRLGRARMALKEHGPALIEFMAAERLDPSLKGAREGLKAALAAQNRPVSSVAPLLQ